MRLMQFLLAATAACALSACDSTTGPVATEEDIAAMQGLTGQVDDAVSSYRDIMGSSSMTTGEACQNAHDIYDARVRPMVGKMMDLGNGMDGYMMDHGGGDVADESCMAASMQAELDRHHAVACAMGTLADDRAEAERHADAMMNLSSRIRGRCDEMMDGATSGSRDFGPMMEGCEDYDGACGMMSQQCGGGMMGR